MRFTKKQIGPGSMTWTVVFQELNGDISSEIRFGSHSRIVAWKQAQKSFKKRVLALIPGNHNVITKKNSS